MSEQNKDDAMIVDSEKPNSSEKSNQFPMTTTTSTSTATDLSTPTETIKFKPKTKSSVEQRLEEAKRKKAEREERCVEMPNRIVLLCDCSGSMSGNSIQCLREAVNSFVDNCNLDDTSVGLLTFGLYRPSSHKDYFDGVPEDEGDELLIPLTTDDNVLKTLASSLEANGGTPMGNALKRALNEIPLTRVVLVSDGSPTDMYPSFDSEDDEQETTVEELPKEVKGYSFKCLKGYLETRTPVDTVHISDSKDGEAVMKYIASKTGGLFIKFKDVNSFRKSFKYLTPQFRFLLTDGDAADLLGADEVRR